MCRDGLGPAAAQFRWAVGIENTFVPQTRAGHRKLDEYELMDHYGRWREDIDLAADVGISTIRYGVPWYRVNPRPGVFDWSWIDPVLEHLVVGRGLTPIVDLLHYGTPLWLDNAFINASYPGRMAEFAGRFADRYASLVRLYTPANEPAVTAAFCGREGRWPPYLTGDDGYMKILLALTRGMNRAAEAIRSARSDALLIHVEDVGLERPAAPEQDAIASEAQARRLLPLDLACGQVTPEHPLFGWLLEHGATPDELSHLAETAPRWDALGLNYYPWSNRRILRRRGGGSRVRAEGDPADLADVLGQVYDRYRLPVMVTETSSPGTHLQRVIWMRETLAAVRRARAGGVPVLGYTWFPLFTMIEWKYRWSRKGLAHHLLHLGLYDVPLRDGRMDREPTPLVEAYRHCIADPTAVVGEWADVSAPQPGLVA